MKEECIMCFNIIFVHQDHESGPDRIVVATPSTHRINRLATYRNMSP